MGSNYTETSFNHHDVELMHDCYAFYAKVRSSGCPLGHSDQLGGFYFPTTYAGVKQVFSDFRNFTSTQGTGLPPQAVALVPVDYDPPKHTKFRRVLNRFFTVDAAEQDRPRVQAIVDGLIDQFIARGSAELAMDFTRPILSQTMLPILGVPIEDQAKIAETLLWMVHYRLVDHEGWLERNGQIAGYLIGLAARRRTSPPVDDLLQCLIDEEFDGRRLTDEEAFHVLLLTLFGSLDTTHSAISGALFHLARHPQDKQRLLSGEVPWATAIEEFLRFTSPIQFLKRTAVNPVDIDGGHLEPGDAVGALNGAGNHDPERFPEPGRCLIDRDARDHLAFGSGAHVCIGRHFARVMIDVALKSMLRRAPDFTVPEDFVPEYGASEARGLQSLPIVFTPQPAQAQQRSSTAAA